MKQKNEQIQLFLKATYAAREAQLMHRGKITLAILAILAIPLRFANSFDPSGVWYVAHGLLLIVLLSTVVMVLFPFRRQWVYASSLSQEDRRHLCQFGIETGTARTLADLKRIAERET